MAIPSIRKGNDITAKWTVTRNGEAEDLDGRNIDVRLVDQFGRHAPVSWTREDNVLTVYFRGRDQRALGDFYLVLCENRDEIGMVTVDTEPAFRLVAHTSQEVLGTAGGAVEVVEGGVELELTSDVNRNGLSAYEVAVSEGFIGTVTEWLASLKGETGATGADGAVGPQGPAGPQGPGIPLFDLGEISVGEAEDREATVEGLYKFSDDDGYRYALVVFERYGNLFQLEFSYYDETVRWRTGNGDEQGWGDWESPARESQITFLRRLIEGLEESSHTHANKAFLDTLTADTLAALNKTLKWKNYGRVSNMSTIVENLKDMGIYYMYDMAGNRYTYVVLEPEGWPMQLRFSHSTNSVNWRTFNARQWAWTAWASLPNAEAIEELATAVDELSRDVETKTHTHNNKTVLDWINQYDIKGLREHNNSIIYSKMNEMPFQDWRDLGSVAMIVLRGTNSENEGIIFASIQADQGNFLYNAGDGNGWMISNAQLSDLDDSNPMTWDKFFASMDGHASQVATEDYVDEHGGSIAGIVTVNHDDMCDGICPNGWSDIAKYAMVIVMEEDQVKGTILLNSYDYEAGFLYAYGGEWARSELTLETLEGDSNPDELNWTDFLERMDDAGYSPLATEAKLAGAVGSETVGSSEGALYPGVEYVAQTLTDEQKTQARNNIGAANSSDLGNLTALTTTDKTSAVAAINEVAGKENFIITYGANGADKTYAEILAAYQRGAVCILLRDTLAYYAQGYNPSSYGMIYFASFAGGVMYRTSVYSYNNTDRWTSVESSGMVASTQTWASNNAKYPSTAAADARFVPKEWKPITTSEFPSAGTGVTIDLGATYKSLLIILQGYSGSASFNGLLYCHDADGAVIGTYSRFMVTTNTRKAWIEVSSLGNKMFHLSCSSPNDDTSNSTDFHKVIDACKPIRSIRFAPSSTNLITAGTILVYGY